MEVQVYGTMFRHISRANLLNFYRKAGEEGQLRFLKKELDFAAQSVQSLPRHCHVLNARKYFFYLFNAVGQLLDRYSM